MSSFLIKNVIYTLRLRIKYNMHKQDLTLNNLQRLIRSKTQPN